MIQHVRELSLQPSDTLYTKCRLNIDIKKLDAFILPTQTVVFVMVYCLTKPARLSVVLVFP